MNLNPDQLLIWINYWWWISY